MEILIISGLSGSGKSRTAAFLEDIGYYIVDNLPAEMMLKFANFCTASGGRHRSTAVAHHLATFIGEQGFPVSESHRDISR